MKKIYWIIIILVALTAYFGYNYIYQDHRNIATEKAAFTVTATSITKEFENDAITAETKYLNKTVEISGRITEVTNTDLTINNTIFCNLSKGLETTTFKLGGKLTIKGRCIGYDDLLELIKLDQCSIKN